MGIIILACFTFKELGRVKVLWSYDAVTLAVSFTSPHSPIGVSAADATTGLGKTRSYST